MARTPSLATIADSALRQELARRERRLKALHRKHAKALKGVAAIEAQIRQLGGDAGGGRRPRNDGSLVEHLAAVLKDKVLGVEEAAEAVLRRGYQSGAANFRLIVNQTVLKRKDLFKRAGRGRYTAK